MQRQEIAVKVEQDTDTEVCRIVATLPNGQYAVLFVTLETFGRSPLWKLEAVGTVGTGNDLTDCSGNWLQKKAN